MSVTRPHQVQEIGSEQPKKLSDVDDNSAIPTNDSNSTPIPSDTNTTSKSSYTIYREELDKIAARLRAELDEMIAIKAYVIDKGGVLPDPLNNKEVEGSTGVAASFKDFFHQMKLDIEPVDDALHELFGEACDKIKPSIERIKIDAQKLTNDQLPGNEKINICLEMCDDMMTTINILSTLTMELKLRLNHALEAHKFAVQLLERLFEIAFRFVQPLVPEQVHLATLIPNLDFTENQEAILVEEVKDQENVIDIFWTNMLGFIDKVEKMINQQVQKITHEKMQALELSREKETPKTAEISEGKKTLANVSALGQFARKPKSMPLVSENKEKESVSRLTYS